MYCMSERVHRGFEIRCKGNYSDGRELTSEILMSRAQSPKKLMVVGAGPAGLECARVLKERRHEVALYEKGPVLGGRLILANASPRKKEVAYFREYMTTQVARLGVKVELAKTVDLETIRREHPDLVITATGATPFVSGGLLPAEDVRNVTTFKEVLGGECDCSGNVAIIGGGVTGCEVAEYICEKSPHSTVTIVGMWTT
jgi:NADPH-dependent 2,4-dienoyl-CoA reductase/sulfur reductase-like enzyme